MLKINNIAYEQYKIIAHKSWSKCKDDLNKFKHKIRKAVDLGKVINPSFSNNNKIVRYHYNNFLVDFSTKEIMMVWECLESDPYHVHRKEKKLYDIIIKDKVLSLDKLKAIIDNNQVFDF